jgi:hypothetical protein
LLSLRFCANRFKPTKPFLKNDSGEDTQKKDMRKQDEGHKGLWWLASNYFEGKFF